MRLRRVNFGLVTLLLALVGIVAWIGVRGSQLQADKRALDTMVRSYVTAYLDVALPPEAVMDAAGSQDALEPETFRALPDVRAGLAEAEAVLRPYFDTRPECWAVAEQDLADGWLSFVTAKVATETGRPGSVSGQQLEQLIQADLTPIDIEMNLNVEGGETMFSAWSSIQALPDRTVWASYNVQALKVDGDWKLNSFASRFVTDLLEGSSY